MALRNAFDNLNLEGTQQAILAKLQGVLLFAFDATEVAIEPGTFVAVGDTSTPILPTRTTRREFILVNDSDVPIYLRLAAAGATVGRGPRLNPNGGAYFSSKYRGPICAVHAAAGQAKNMTVTEI